MFYITFFFLFVVAQPKIVAALEDLGFMSSCLLV